MSDLICVRCGSRDRTKSGRCRPCHKAATAAWDRANPERKKTAKRNWAKNNPAQVLFHTSRHRAIKCGYQAMPLEECQKAVASRPELCEACQTKPTTDCDHDHKTGVFRGWLCSGCNRAEGLLGGEKQVLGLLEYIRKHK